MAGPTSEDEYESDPEEVKLSLKMRRREASDDEQERETEDPRAGVTDSEAESDGQGAPAEYEDEDEDEDEDGEEEEYYDDEGEEEVVEAEYEEREVGIGGEVQHDGVGVEKGVGVGEGEEDKVESEGQQGKGEEEEKKENEPFAVPTSGAFYMHDDRFRDNAAPGARNRRTFGGRKLWESKDDRKWGHDKFEEMNMQDRSYEEGRRPSKGFHRGRGRGRGADRGYPRGSRPKGLGANSNQSNTAPKDKDVRGRGPRRYHPSMKNRSDTLPPQNKQSSKSLDRTSSHAGSGRHTASTTANSNTEHDMAPAKKVASNLNSASPPFYPSGSSNKETTLTTKKEVQSGSNNRSVRPAAAEQNFSAPLSNSLLRGKNVNDSIGMDRLLIDDSVPPGGAKPLNNVHLPSSSGASSQMPQPRAQGRGVSVTPSVVFHPPQTNSQVSRTLPSSTAQALQQSSGSTPNRGQPSQGSPPKAGKGAVQGTGRGSLVYGGAQVMGSGGSMGAGDPNLPAFFPVMPFGGQHPGGIGVPAVGMAFPGYVAQPNGLGNSEMTWLPVLASAAGALGATYCPPYIVDSSYNPRPTAGQASALPGPSKDNNPIKANNDLKAQQRSDFSSDEFSQRQNKPRRYSEMNFSQ